MRPWWLRTCGRAAKAVQGTNADKAMRKAIRLKWDFREIIWGEAEVWSGCAPDWEPPARLEQVPEYPG